MPELAKRAISKLETRKYKFPSAKVVRVPSPVSDVYSCSSGLEQCAICLEEYRESQVTKLLLFYLSACHLYNMTLHVLSISHKLKIHLLSFNTPPPQKKKENKLK